MLLNDDYIVWDLGRMHITCSSCVSVYCIMSLEFYKHCLVYAILPSWMTWCPFSTYSWIYLMMGHLNVKIHNQSVATLKHACYSEVCVLLMVLSQKVFKHFMSIISWFFKVTTKLNASSMFLKLCHFTGLQKSQDALDTDTLNCQLYKNTVFCYSDTH